MEKKFKSIIIISILLLQTLIPQVSQATEEQFTFFGEDITYEWKYVETTDELMGYGLLIPSTAKKNAKLPMIVSLHGYGGSSANEEALYGGALPSTLKGSKKWKLNNYSAYVLIPYLKNYNDSWQNNTSMQKLEVLLEKIIKEHNIDRNHIAISGESRGGTAALFAAHYFGDYFSKCIVFSPFYSGPFNTSIDTLCFYSWYADGASEYAKYLKTAYGEDRVFSNDSGHGSVGYTFLCQDGGVLTDARIRNSTVITALILLNGCLETGFQKYSLINQF